MEYLELLRDWALRVWGLMEPTGWMMVGLSTMTVMLLIYLKSDLHLERAMARRKKRANHREMLDQGQQAITEAFENKHKSGAWTREKTDHLYRLIRGGVPEFKELGPNPTFGKPWYTGPQPFKNVQAVKASIWNRLRKSGKSINELIDKKRRIAYGLKPRQSAQEDHAAFIAAIKKTKI